MFSINGNKLCLIESVEQLLGFWKFFQEGLESLNDTIGTREKVTSDSFFKLLIHVISKNPGFGIIGVLTSKNDKPLGFGVAFNDTDIGLTKSAVVYAVYSNKRCPTTVKELQDIAETWARENGFHKLHACSRRLNGSVMRLFEKKWGFHRTAIIFEKDLT